MANSRTEQSGKINKLLLCDCEETMRFDESKLNEALGQDIVFHTQLCRRQISSFETEIENTPCIIGCTQEIPIFHEISEEKKALENAKFVNIRERAGWSADSKNITPKMAALLAETELQTKPARAKTIESDGLCFIYGAGQVALDAAIRLAKHLPVSLILTQYDEVILPETITVPIYKGKIDKLSGGLGAFTLSVEGYAAFMPSAKEELQFAKSRSAELPCSLFLDLTGDTPLVAAPEKRDGYFRVDPNDPVRLSETLFDLIDMVGVFEKPIYVEYNSEICAHSRSKKVGCTNCLDVCVPSAITPQGDGIAVDFQICAGCGACAAVCPTGAVSYTTPYRDDLVKRVQTLATRYLQAGGERPVLLIHDDAHGMPLISIMARYGQGLPGHVIPLSLYSITTIGHDIFAAALAAGFESVVVLGNPKKQDEFASIDKEILIVRDILKGVQADHDLRLVKLVESDPDVVESYLYELPSIGGFKPTTFVPLGTRREIARAAISSLVKAAEQTVEIIPLSENAPYGQIKVNTDGCTLCLACVSSCPANALADNPDMPQVRFTEAACVQCGICKNTCPEQVITLEPRMNLTPSAMQPITLYEEEPFECISCGKPFAPKSTIERIMGQLAGDHWMFKSDRAELLKMCDDCRIQTQAEASGGDPFAYGKRPKIMTAEDYIEADKQGLTIEDFLKQQDEI